MSSTRWRILGTVFLVSLVFLVVWGLIQNHAAHRDYGHQLPARVVSVTPEKKIELWLAPDRHYRLANLEVTTQSGKKWYYENAPVKSEVVKGMGLHAWISNPGTGSKMYYEKASVTRKDQDEPWSPFYSWQDLILFPLFLAGGVGWLAYFLTMPFYRGNRGGGSGPDDPDPRDPDDSSDGPQEAKPLDQESERIHRELNPV